MRCLYCGIRLKIADKAQAIKLCPECSVRMQYEALREERPDPLLRAEDRSRRLKAVSTRRAAFAQR